MKIPFLLSFFCASLGAQGALLMLDFGPTTVTGANRTNSPYHSQNPTFTDLSWNKIETADVTSGIVLSDGTSTSISINLGYGNQTTLVDLSQQPSNSNILGSSINDGIYTGNSVATDGIYTGSGTQVRHTGVNITGLPAGVYEVYVATRNTNTSSGSYSMTAYVGAGAANTNFDFVEGGYASSEVTFTTTGSTGAWVQEGADGENFHRLTVTIEDGQAINIAVAASSEQGRGFLNMIQIAPVPEPSSALLALAAALPLFCRRRRTV